MRSRSVLGLGVVAILGVSGACGLPGTPDQREGCDDSVLNVSPATADEAGYGTYPTTACADHPFDSDWFDIVSETVAGALITCSDDDPAGNDASYSAQRNDDQPVSGECDGVAAPIPDVVMGDQILVRITHHDLGTRVDFTVQAD